jgi:hypothetical protein
MRLAFAGVNIIQCGYRGRRLADSRLWESWVMTHESGKKGIIDSVRERLFSGRHGKLANIKFYRGPKELITVEEFNREVHAALVQRELDHGKISKEPVESAVRPIDVREYVSKL